MTAAVKGRLLILTILGLAIITVHSRCTGWIAFMVIVLLAAVV